MRNFLALFVLLISLAHAERYNAPPIHEQNIHTQGNFHSQGNQYSEHSNNNYHNNVNVNRNENVNINRNENINVSNRNGYWSNGHYYSNNTGSWSNNGHWQSGYNNNWNNGGNNNNWNGNNNNNGFWTGLLTGTVFTGLIAWALHDSNSSNSHPVVYASGGSGSYNSSTSAQSADDNSQPQPFNPAYPTTEVASSGDISDYGGLFVVIGIILLVAAGFVWYKYRN